jgi:Hsp20/alpha crystallin family
LAKIITRSRSPLAGFSPDEITITAEQNVLTVEGRKADEANRDFLYRGISAQGFKRQFNLADYVQVKAAAFENGLLRIELVRELPEAMKPRRIPIGAAEQIARKQAAALPDQPTLARTGTHPCARRSQQTERSPTWLFAI